MSSWQKYFDPEILAAIQPLGLRVSTLVEGLVAGLHRSPLRGQSIEFSQHREYVPGDDLRQVDWKVFARSDKHYLRQYEDETNLTATILVDLSESMKYRGTHTKLSKLEYAQLIACSLAYSITRQQDQVGVALYSDSLDHWLAPSSNLGQLEDLVSLLERAESKPATDLPRVLRACFQRLRKSGLVIVVSDLLDQEATGIAECVKLARYAGHELMLIQVLDPDELDFPFDEAMQFDGVETAVSINTNALLIAGAYRRAIQEYCASIESVCLTQEMDYCLMRTDESLAVTLPKVLSTRLLRRS